MVVTRRGTLDEVEVKIELSETQQQALNLHNLASVEQLAANLQRKIKDNIGITMQVKLHAVGEIPRSEGGKLQRVLDLRR